MNQNNVFIKNILLIYYYGELKIIVDSKIVFKINIIIISYRMIMVML